MLLAFKGRQYLADAEALAQRVHVGPMIVQCYPPRIGVPDRLQSEPILDFTFLPVHRWQILCKRRESRLIGRNRGLEDEELRIGPLLEYVIEIEDALPGDAILREHGYQPGAIFSAEKIGHG